MSMRTYDDIQAIIHNRLVGIWNVQKMHIAFFVTFAFFEDIVYVTVNDGSVTKEQV